jgi:hypothetical protein
MTTSHLLAATHGGSIPSPVTILLAVAAVGYVLWSRTKGQPLRSKRLLVLPVILTIIGITDLSGSSAPHLTPKDVAFVAVSVIISVALGAARGATIELYPQQGELWQRYRSSTVGLWIAIILIRVVLVGVASAAHASPGAGTDTLLLALGASLLAEAAVVGPRALSTGLPFAADEKGADARTARSPRRRPSPATRLFDMELPPERSSSTGTGLNEELRRSDPSHNDPMQWRSPSLRDGIDWVRNQIERPPDNDQRTPRTQPSANRRRNEPPDQHRK